MQTLWKIFVTEGIASHFCEKQMTQQSPTVNLAADHFAHQQIMCL